MSNVVVIVFEPAAPVERLSLAGQVQQVFGVFESDTTAEHWIETFKRRCPGRWQFLITYLDSPNAIPTDSSLN